MSCWFVFNKYIYIFFFFLKLYFFLFYQWSELFHFFWFFVYELKKLYSSMINAVIDNISLLYIDFFHYVYFFNSGCFVWFFNFFHNILLRNCLYFFLFNLFLDWKVKIIFLFLNLRKRIIDWHFYLYLGWIVLD